MECGRTFRSPAGGTGVMEPVASSFSDTGSGEKCLNADRRTLAVNTPTDLPWCLLTMKAACSFYMIGKNVSVLNFSCIAAETAGLTSSYAL